jgi:hypothetical protein
MSLPGKAKTKRRAKRSLVIQEAIREALENGPVSATKMHDMLYQRFDIEPYSSLYHAKCIGVRLVGRNPRARLWELPKQRIRSDRSWSAEESEPGGLAELTNSPAHE